MKIFEVADPSIQKLVTLARFLSGRATDSGAKQQIGVSSFLNLARGQGITLSIAELTDLTQAPPLNNLIQPMKPGDNTLNFVTPDAQPASEVKMPVNQAQNIVASAAKSAMKRAMK